MTQPANTGTSTSPGAPATLDAGPEQLKRSIESLQRLYTIVVGLAVTEALRAFLTFQPVDPSVKWWVNWRVLGVLLVTIVPFYHGANAHLDQYIYGFDGVRREKRYALLIDFAVLFFEGVLFLMLALSLGNFYFAVKVFQGILLVDILWAGFVYMTGDKQTTDSSYVLNWAKVNFFALVAVSLVVDLNALQDATRSNWVFSIAVVRTVVDYVICHNFYLAPYQMLKSAGSA